MKAETVKAVKAFHDTARKHDIKAVDMAALPCGNVSIDGKKAAELCPKTLCIRELESGLYELKDRIKQYSPRSYLLSYINQLLKKGR